MNYDPKFHARKSVRLPGYDYRRSGLYYVTLRTASHQRLFGHLVRDVDTDTATTILNQFGAIVHEQWVQTAAIRREIELDEFAVLPDHLHAIVKIGRRHSGNTDGASAGSLGSFVGGFKSAVTSRIREMGDGQFPGPIWQRNYYDHVIRGDRAVEGIREYIRNNATKHRFDYL